MNRFPILLCALSLLTGPARSQQPSCPTAQSPETSVYEFRFVTDEDMFYVPWNGNGEELERLIACVTQNREEILDGSIPVLVDGYCNSQPSVAGNLAMAKVRSNRVKTEMILRGRITEDCFRTRNHVSGGNFVTVRIIFPAAPGGSSPAAESSPAAGTDSAAETDSAKKSDSVAESPSATDSSSVAGTDSAAETDSESFPGPITPVLEEPREEFLEEPREEPLEAASAPDLAVRANLLRWVTLTPDIGIEWRIDDRWGVGINASWASWTWSNNARRYALWEVAPEGRYYLGERRAWHLGAMFKVGQFNYKFSSTGRQGDLVGGGITGGYRLRLNEALALDFNLGLGCLSADYEKYEVIDGVRVRRGNGSKSWWGPIDAGVTLMWKIF